MKKRTFTRLIAVQTLYQFFFFEKNKKIGIIKEEIINYYSNEKEDGFVDKTLKEIDQNFLDQLLNEIFLNLEIIDEKIEKITKRESDLLLKQILRLGILELIVTKNTPKNVIIDEYVTIANKFYDRNVVNFVNGVLNEIGLNPKQPFIDNI